MRSLDPTKQPKKFCIPNPNLMENFQHEYTCTKYIYIYIYIFIYITIYKFITIIFFNFLR